MIIDTHCHLISDKYPPMEEVLASSLELGVSHCICQGTDPADWQGALDLAERFPSFVSPCLALHPMECTRASAEDWAQMLQLCRQRPLAAIGEAGLDYFWDAPEGWSEEDYHARQRIFLEWHFALAEELGLNISLHTRDKLGGGTACFDDALAIARNFPKVRPVFHCFIGSQAQADVVFGELDGMISFTGLLTFKKTEAVQAVAAACPADRYMLETDAPFLSPAPYRGQVNIPGRTRFVAEKMAELRNVPLEQVAVESSANARRFFRLNPQCPQA